MLANTIVTLNFLIFPLFIYIIIYCPRIPLLFFHIPIRHAVKIYKYILFNVPILAFFFLHLILIYKTNKPFIVNTRMHTTFNNENDKYKLHFIQTDNAFLQLAYWLPTINQPISFINLRIMPQKTILTMELLLTDITYKKREH